MKSGLKVCLVRNRLLKIKWGLLLPRGELEKEEGLKSVKQNLFIQIN